MQITKMNLEICFLKVPDKVKTILMRDYMPTLLNWDMFETEFNPLNQALEYFPIKIPDEG